MSDLKAHWLEEGKILYEGEVRVDSAPGAGGKDRSHSTQTELQNPARLRQRTL